MRETDLAAYGEVNQEYFNCLQVWYGMIDCAERREVEVEKKRKMFEMKKRLTVLNMKSLQA